MSIPLATTTIDVLRDANAIDDDSEYQQLGTVITERGTKLITVARNVRANIGSPSAVPEVLRSGSEQLQIALRMQCDPCEVNHLDSVRDNKTGKVYNVMWVIPRDELGIVYYQVGLRISEGTEFSTL